MSHYDPYAFLQESDYSSSDDSASEQEACAAEIIVIDADDGTASTAPAPSPSWSSPSPASFRVSIGAQENYNNSRATSISTSHGSGSRLDPIVVEDDSPVDEPCDLNANVKTNRKRTPSPARSVVSLTESMREMSVRDAFGRKVASTSEIYKLPVDDVEWDRQQKQHALFIELFGEKYPPVLPGILSSDNTGGKRKKRVLDLGCGDGSWIKGIAREFPHCQAVGVDLVPMEDTRDLPKNLTNEVDDINLGLNHFYNQFTVVHARLIASGIKDYHLLIEEISRVLRPGGLIILSEFDFALYDSKHERMDVNIHEPLGPPWCARFAAFMHEAVRVTGGDMDAAAHLQRWVSTHRAFENVVYQERWCPVVPGNDPRLQGPLLPMLKEIVARWLYTGKPLLLESGVISQEAYDVLIENAMQEIMYGEHLEPQFSRIQCVYATKKSDIEVMDIS